MPENLDLKKIEETILKMGHQHGLFDMSIGFIVFGMGLGPIFRESLPSPYRYFLWPLILVIIACLSIFIILKYVIQPRTGIFKPGPSLKSTGKKLFIVTTVQFITHIIFIILVVNGNFTGIHLEGILFILIIGLFFMPLFVILAFLLKYPRLYLIGMLIWLAIFINESIYDSLDYRFRWPISYGIPGAIIFFMGLIIFIRFIRRYPLPKKEVAKI
ncbi:MAG: hypothetical protein ACFFCV_19840 [Promethearchaeota archaeon]